jgi:hypothetical protein
MLKNTFPKKGFSAYLLLVGLAFISLHAHSQAIITSLGSPIPLYNGSDLSAWQGSGKGNGNASWQLSDQEISVTQGHGLLVTRLSVPDFIVEFDYWVDKDAQVSTFFRCANPEDINTETAYEVTLVNQLNGIGAGSIFLLNKLKPSKVANQWNHIKISAIGTDLSVTLNGVTHQVLDTRFASGPLAINYLGGEFRLKNVYFTIPGRW